MTENRTQRQVIITRTFNAPRDLVWQMWTVPEHFKQWWGPKDSTTPFCTIDLRVGGEIRFADRNPDGTDLWQKGVYLEIVPQERIVYTHSFADPEGNIVPGSYYGIPSDWLALDVTVSFESAGRQTTLTISHDAPDSEFTDMVEQGWREGLAKMATAVEQSNKTNTSGGKAMHKMNVIAEPGSHEILMTREFDAPRDLVFSVYTDPALIPQWWGPARYTTSVDKMDVTKAGQWRYVQHDAAGNEFAFNGVYHHVAAPECLIYTFEWEGMPGHVGLVTLRFEETAGRTKLIESTVFQSVEDRDGMAQSDMEEGASESMDRLEEILAARKATV